MSLSTPLISETVLRPVVSGTVAVLLDRMVLKQTDLKKSLVFGASVGAGIAIGSFTANSLIPDTTPTASFANGKQIGTRLLEIMAGSSSAFLVNKYVLKNSTDKVSVMKKMAVILVADVAGEYASDYMSGRPLAFMA